MIAKLKEIITGGKEWCKHYGVLLNAGDIPAKLASVPLLPASASMHGQSL